MMQVQFDHAVVFVPDLQAATVQFEDLGFTVTAGGEHKQTHNALIFFQDQTYLELLAVKPGWRKALFWGLGRTGVLIRSADKRDDILWRLYRWVVARPGPIDWCVRVENMRNTEERLKNLDIPTVKSMDFDRQRPDGKQVKWWLGSARDLDLPFMLTDITPMNVRIERGKATQHPNGALGIQRVTIATENHARAVSRLSAVLEQPGSASEGADALFHLVNTEVFVPKKLQLVGKFALDIFSSRDEVKQLPLEDTFGLTVRLVPTK